MKKLNSMRYYLLFFFMMLFLYITHDSLFINENKRISNVVSYCAYPVLLFTKYFQQQWVEFHQVYIDRKCLCSHIDILRNDNEFLRSQVIAHAAQTLYYEQIEPLIAFRSRYNVQAAILTHVILYMNDIEKYMYVDCGSQHNVVKDMVAVYKNCLVGRVIEVFPYYSKVLLITDPHCPIAACCATTKTKGIHNGVLGLQDTCLMHVGHMENLIVGDMVLSSGIGTIFPEGFLIGTIKHFVVDGVCYAITISPSLDFSLVQYCYLVKKGE